MRNLVLPILISYKDHSKTMCNGTTDLKLQNVFLFTRRPTLTYLFTLITEHSMNTLFRIPKH
jgi:hypothetical protein